MLISDSITLSATRRVEDLAAIRLGLYVSIPFCKSKCSYCNFASGVFPRQQMQAYVERVCADVAGARELASFAGAFCPDTVDSIYFGGGTPTLLEPEQLQAIFAALAKEFRISPGAEITVECAPGTLTGPILAALAICGVNRVSLGVQSFVDAEARAVGRLHNAAVVASDVERLRRAGIQNVNVDLIAGLPHQTEASWLHSLDMLIALGVPHASIYMLEVDEDSRLGGELLAGGTRFHAHFVPDDEQTAAFYSTACQRLERAGISQYEISNFARAGHGSRHNLKYWQRKPYFGFGLDAHSMLPNLHPESESVRIAMPDALPAFLESRSARDVSVTRISPRQAWEESFFLGLRLNRGVDLAEIASSFGAEWAERARKIARELAELGLVELSVESLRLTPRGRLLSNEVFERFLLSAAEPSACASNTISA